jgi:hypothetical protein
LTWARRASPGNPLLTVVFDPLIGHLHGQSAGRFVFRGSIRIVPPVDLTVFSI